MIKKRSSDEYAYDVVCWFKFAGEEDTLYKEGWEMRPKTHFNDELLMPRDKKAEKELPPELEAYGVFCRGYRPE